jgi:hypothetical protein
VRVALLALPIVVLVLLAGCGGTSIEDAAKEAAKENRGLDLEDVDVSCEKAAVVEYAAEREDVYTCALAGVENAGGDPAVFGCYMLIDGEAVNAREALGTQVAAPGREGIDCGVGG